MSKLMKRLKCSIVPRTVKEVCLRFLFINNRGGTNDAKAAVAKAGNDDRSVSDDK